jgi:hypothetical protein
MEETFEASVTDWMRGDRHPVRDGWYQFRMYGSAPEAVHMREYRGGAWRSTLNPEAKFNALHLDQWRGLRYDQSGQSAAQNSI